MVHEKTSCKCAERPVLQEWFKENNYELKEWLPEKQKSLYTKYDILGDVLDSTGKQKLNKRVVVKST